MHVQAALYHIKLATESEPLQGMEGLVERQEPNKNRYIVGSLMANSTDTSKKLWCFATFSSMIVIRGPGAIANLVDKIVNLFSSP